MLEIVIPEVEIFNEVTSKLITIPPETMRLEHSLSSLSKWEQTFEKPFFSKTKKTQHELIAYVCMMADPPVAKHIAANMTNQNIEELNTYLSAKHSATWFSDDGQQASSNQTVTAELIYYWMTAFSIPFECDRWPLGFLMNLIKICQLKSDTDKKKGKMSSRVLSERAALNAKRREEQKSEG